MHPVRIRLSTLQLPERMAERIAGVVNLHPARVARLRAPAHDAEARADGTLGVLDSVAPRSNRSRRWRRAGACRYPLVGDAGC